MQISLNQFIKITFIFTVFSLTSCREVFIELFVKDRSAIKKMKILENDQKRIIYIPMVHVGSEKYYREVNEFLTQKRADGYTIYYESVKYGPGLKREEKVIVDLKLRRLLGVHLTAFDNRDNESLPGHVTDREDVYQSNERIGIDTLRDVHADLTRQELVQLYEQEYGKIELDSCDINTPLLAKYTCGKGIAYHKVAYTYRDDALANKLVAADHDKIVLLFGKGHWNKIYHRLVDNNDFILVHGKF